MVNDKLLIYLKSQLAKNLTKDQITTSLTSSGWQPKDIEAGFAALNPVKILPIILSSLVIFSTVCGLTYFGFTKFAQSNKTLVVDEQAPSPTSISTSSSTAATNCDSIPTYLKTCAPYTCEFVHPFTNTTMKKFVKGIIDGKCLYEEEMPNNGKMTCKYDEATRVKVADYDQKVNSAVQNGQSIDTSLSADLSAGTSQASTSLSGQAVENPIQTSMADGTCVVTGY